MPPLPAFLSNLQQPAPAQPYGAHTNTNSALAGSPAQYLTSRPYQGSAAAPQYPAVSGMSSWDPGVEAVREGAVTCM